MASFVQDGPRDAPVRAQIGTALLSALLLLVPLFFLSDTSDAFECPKVTLLCLVAVLLAALGISAWIDAVLRGAWRSDALPRLKELLCDPLGLATLLFVLSSLISTWFSISPRT